MAKLLESVIFRKNVSVSGSVGRGVAGCSEQGVKLSANSTRQ